MDGTNIPFSGITATTGTRSGSSTNTAYNQAALKVYPLYIPTLTSSPSPPSSLLPPSSLPPSLLLLLVLSSSSRSSSLSCHHMIYIKLLTSNSWRLTILLLRFQSVFMLWYASLPTSPLISSPPLYPSHALTPFPCHSLMHMLG